MGCPWSLGQGCKNSQNSQRPSGAQPITARLSLMRTSPPLPKTTSLSGVDYQGVLTPHLNEHTYTPKVKM